VSSGTGHWDEWRQLGISGQLMKLTNKRLVEILLCASIFLLLPLLIATNEIMEHIEQGVEIALWKPFLTEYSSAIVVLLLLPILLYVDQRVPIASNNWSKRILLHLPLSVAFSIAHITGMYTIRHWVYLLVGEQFETGNIWWAFLFEYRKDLVVYIGAMVIIYGYREIIRLRVGEAQLAKSTEGKDDDRILVSKSGLFHFIEPTTIHWVEAAGNYVELHTATETYMLRSTMKEIESRLDSFGFVRVHRSTIVNRSQIERIAPAMNGDKIVKLRNGFELRLSRRYRQNLEQPTA
jgi:hypothetical protein